MGVRLGVSFNSLSASALDSTLASDEGLTLFDNDLDHNNSLSFFIPVPFFQFGGPGTYNTRFSIPLSKIGYQYTSQNTLANTKITFFMYTMFLIIQNQPAAVFEDAFRLLLADAVFINALSDITSIPLKFSSHRTNLTDFQIQLPLSSFNSSSSVKIDFKTFESKSERLSLPSYKL